MNRTIRLSPGLMNPESIRGRLEARVKAARDKIAMQALTGIVLRTPVDTGRARSNWHVSTEGPDVSVRQAFVDGKGGSTGGANAGAVIAEGAATIADATPFGKIFISNGLPYINRLEHGWSGQAPAGMVRVTLDEIQAQFQT